MITPIRLHLDLAGLLASAAGEILSALDLADVYQKEGPVEIQITEIHLDFPAVMEYLPGRSAGGPRVVGRLRVRPPSTWPMRRSRRPGRLRLALTPREETVNEQ